MTYDIPEEPKEKILVDNAKKTWTYNHIRGLWVEKFGLAYSWGELLKNRGPLEEYVAPQDGDVRQYEAYSPDTGYFEIYFNKRWNTFKKPYDKLPEEYIAW